jgi:M6 family metalloprotease-like protein
VGLGVLLGAGAARADFIDHFSTPEDVGAAKVPRVGEPRILVLTLQVDGFPEIDMDEVRAYFGATSEPGEANFVDFYDRMSLGSFRPQVEVAEPLRLASCPLPEDYFGYEDCAIPRGGGPTGADKTRSLEVGLALLQDLLRQADEELGVDFSRYDLSGPEGQPDGWVDGVLLLHNLNFGGIALPLYALAAPQEAPSFDGVSVGIVGVAESPAVALHEFGHLLGWADLYDESGQTKGLPYSHMGSWDYDEPPLAVDAFSRWKAGWTQPTYVVREGETMTDLVLPPSADTGAMLQLGDGKEFFLVENRGNADGDYMDWGIRERGLAVYHVNLNRYPSPNAGQWLLRLVNCLNCDPWRPMLMSEQADGLFELQKPGFRRDDEGDLFRAGDMLVPSVENTAPLGANNKVLSSNRSDGGVTGVYLTNLRQEGDDFVVDARVEVPCDLLACEAGCEDGKCLPAPEPDPEPVEPEVEPEPDLGGDEDADAGGAPSGAQGGGGGGCATSPARAGWGGCGWLLVGLAWRWRRRRASLS